MFGSGALAQSARRKRRRALLVCPCPGAKRPVTTQMPPPFFGFATMKHTANCFLAASIDIKMYRGFGLLDRLHPCEKPG